MVEVNQGDTPDITINFYNSSSVLTAPSAATWRLIDLDTNTELVASTNISPIASSVEISVPATATAIVNDKKKFEKRRIIVEATFSGSKKKFGVYDFQVKNIIEGDV